MSQTTQMDISRHLERDSKDSNEKTTTKKTKKRRTKKTAKKNKILIIRNVTPKDDAKISTSISQSIKTSKPSSAAATMDAQPPSKSYSPEINLLLRSKQSMNRKSLTLCNHIEILEDYSIPLQIMIDGVCVDYNDERAKRIFLKNLSANRHIDPKKVITPMQVAENCWFNTIFVAYFISDKGRKFFHFFRKYMIEGKTFDGNIIPRKLHNAFALLNYGIESCILGNDFSYTFDTNYIINNIYSNLPPNIREQEFIVDVNNYSNGFYYFKTILEYINAYDVNIDYFDIENTTTHFGSNQEPYNVVTYLENYNENLYPLDIIVIWANKIIYYDKEKQEFVPNDVLIKPTEFNFDGYKYKLDSCILRDNSMSHFSAFITCDNKEYCFDGASFRRLTPFKWKHLINKNKSIKFEKDKDFSNYTMESFTWNFKIGFQMLFYYRVK